MPELYETSSWSWETAHETTGSGIAVVKRIGGEYKVLGLWAYGGFDIPKGHVESGDDIFSTALREAAEEAGITQLDFRWGKQYKKIDNLYIYLAETGQDPFISYNEKEGLYEHESAEWLSWGLMLKQCYEYLRPAIFWAKGKVEGSENIF